MLPSKPLYGSDKKPSSSDNDPTNNFLPPPPPYSEYNNSASNSSGYSGGYHERTPTAPPASLLTAANENPPYHYPMPSPSHTNPSYPNYGTVENSSSRYVPDADDYTNNNNNNNNSNNASQQQQPQQQQPLLSSSSVSSQQKSFKAMIYNCYKNNRYVNYCKTHRWSIKKIVCVLCFIVVLIWIIVTGNMDRDHNKIKTPPNRPPSATPSRVIMNSPYPLSPSHYEYANNDTKKISDLPISTLTTLAVDFTSHTGELHLVSTDDPVSWLSFSTSSGQLNPTLASDFTLRNATSLQVVIQKDSSSSSYYSNRLTAVLHLSRHDRQHARLIVKVDTMLVYAISEDPDDMIQDIDVTLKGPQLGLTLPEKTGWKGKNMRIKLEGNNGSFSVSRLEASGTISLELTGLAGGDLELQQSIVAKHIRLSSKNGSIVMRGPGASMTADTIDLTTTNSKLLVGSIRAKRHCSLRTSNGSIDVTLDNNQEELDRLDVQSENSSIHITALPLIKRASIISNLGSITMHTTQNFDGWFDIQSSLSKTTVEDNESGKLKLDVAGKTIKQGRRGRGTQEHQIKLFSYAGSSRLVFDQ